MSNANHADLFADFSFYIFSLCFEEREKEGLDLEPKTRLLLLFFLLEATNADEQNVPSPLPLIRCQRLSLIRQLHVQRGLPVIDSWKTEDMCAYVYIFESRDKNRLDKERVGSMHQLGVNSELNLMRSRRE